MSDEFSPAERASFYRIVESRRDVRAFRPDAVPDDVLHRILTAAHHGPSVGFMQPWNFIIIRDPAIRRSIKTVFLRENERAATKYRGDRVALYRSLKLEGIEEAPLNVCVTCDRTRSGPDVLGRNTIIDTDLYSTCCAIQNLWLAARAEGIGVGWVSVLTNDDLRRILGIPDHVVPVAYLCLGYAREFLEEPELQQRGWAARLSLDELLFSERWGSKPSPAPTPPGTRAATGSAC
jgi:5,6-dimethylbenzimidazole synthase